MQSTTEETLLFIVNSKKIGDSYRNTAIFIGNARYNELMIQKRGELKLVKLNSVAIFL